MTESAKKPESGTIPAEKLGIPTVGRIVMYTPRPWEERAAPGPWAALVTAVHEATDTVTLAVFPPTPTPVGTDPVQRAIGVKQGTEPGTWAWPGRV